MSIASAATLAQMGYGPTVNGQPVAQAPMQYPNNDPDTYYKQQIYGPNWQTNPQYLKDSTTFRSAGDPVGPAGSGANGPIIPPAGSQTGAGQPPAGGFKSVSQLVQYFQQKYPQLNLDQAQWEGYINGQMDPAEKSALANGTGSVSQGTIGYWGDKLANMANGSGSGAGGAGAAPGGSPADIMAQDPGYQFRFDQGQQAVQRSAAAKGTLLTGGTLKDLTQYGQGFASNEFGNIFNRNFDVAQLGLNAAGQANQAGSGYGTTVGGLQTGSGAINAAGNVAQNNNTKSTINAGANQVNQAIQDWSKKAPATPSAGGGTPAPQATDQGSETPDPAAIDTSSTDVGDETDQG